jgi:hypothetical protein
VVLDKSAHSAQSKQGFLPGASFPFSFKNYTQAFAWQLSLEIFVNRLLIGL